MCVPPRARAFGASVVPASNPGPKRGIAIPINPMVTDRQLIADNTHRLELASAQIIAIAGDILHDRMPSAVTPRKGRRWSSRMPAVHDHNISETIVTKMRRNRGKEEGQIRRGNAEGSNNHECNT